MKLKDILHNRKNHIIFASLLILLLVYLAIRIIFPGSFSLTQLLTDITNPYLILVEKFANLILHWTGSSLTIQNHNIWLNGMPVNGFTAQLMYKKFTLFYLLIVWLSNSSILKKSWFTGIYLVISFLAASGYNVAGAYSITSQNSNNSIISTTHSLVFFGMNTILLLWYRVNKGSFSGNSPTVLGITKLLERKLAAIIVVIYAYIFILFSVGYFDFRLLIDFILKSSQIILGALGYDATAEFPILIGNNGSISLYRTCLGIMTMFLFAALVFLTGNKHKRGWGFIIFGLLVLNLANIIRIVLLFIYIQKHGTEFAMDVHDMYNYITYSLVFILWVIWFEKFMNIRGKKRA
jgi:exosortase/archaeosortase family protein